LAARLVVQYVFAALLLAKRRRKNRTCEHSEVQNAELTAHDL